MPRTALSMVAVAVAAALATTSCGTSTNDATASVPSPSPSPSVAPLAKATGKQVLLMAGAVGGQPGGRLAVDMNALDALPQHELTVQEPFLKKSITFSGVLFRDLFAATGTNAAATSVHIHALDDYQKTFQIADLVAQGAVLATREAGAVMPVKQGGPTRMIFPEGTPMSRNGDLWVWNVDVITVR